MQKRALGTHGPELSLLSLGSWYTYPRLTFESIVDLIGESLDLGMTTFDVAYYPTQPYNEVLFARALAETGTARESVQIMDKVWFWDEPGQSLMAQMDSILARLGHDYVDVIMCEHLRPGMSVQDIAGQMAEIVRSGKAKAWTGMDWDPKDLVEAHRLLDDTPELQPQGLEMKYNVARQSVVEGEDFETLAARGMSLIPSDTLEGGILAGRTDLSRGIGIDTGGIRDEIYQLAAELKNKAGALGVTSAQLALAFTAAHPSTATVVFGATRSEHLRENVDALQILDNPDIAVIVKELKTWGIGGHAVDLPYKPKARIGADYVR